MHNSDSPENCMVDHHIKNETQLGGRKKPTLTAWPLIVCLFRCFYKPNGKEKKESSKEEEKGNQKKEEITLSGPQKGPR